MYVMILSEIPSTDRADYDDLMDDILAILDSRHQYDKAGHYELLVLCAGGRHRPSWSWLVQAFARLAKIYKKDLQRLLLVHGKKLAMPV